MAVLRSVLVVCRAAAVGSPSSHIQAVTLSFIAVLGLLFFILSQPGYDIRATPFTSNDTSITDSRNAVWKLPNSEPQNYSRTLVSGGLQSHPPLWFGRLPRNMDKKYYPVFDNTTGYVNKGHEAMFYLTFIIDNYHDLPDFLIFVHDHRRSWHNSDSIDRSILPLLRDLRWSYLKSEGFVNLRCQRSPNCPTIAALQSQRGSVLGPRPMTHFFDSAWTALFSSTFGPRGTIASPCCAQFAVTSEAVKLRPLKFYEDARTWLIETEGSDWALGRVFEYTWHIIFGKPAINCIELDTCRRDVYGYLPDII